MKIIVRDNSHMVHKPSAAKHMESIEKCEHKEYGHKRGEKRGHGMSYGKMDRIGVRS
jgi:hypothetical protein